MRSSLIARRRYAGSAITVAAADGVTFTEVARVTVDAEPVPVMLSGYISVQATTLAQQANFLVGILPVGGNLFNLKIGAARLLVGGPSSTNAEPEGRDWTGWVVLDPNSPGEYFLGATRKSGSNAGQILGTSLIPTQLVATRLG